MLTSSRVALVAVLGALSCKAQHDVALELPHGGRALSSTETQELQSIADAAFHDVRARLDGLPPRITLIVRWGKDVIPETGENGTASYPGNVMWTIDPDRDALATIRTQLRPTLFHELHHLARESRVRSTTLVDHVVTEGLATAFERDFAEVDPPWGKEPPDAMAWTQEILRQPEASELEPWMSRHPDGRRWIGIRVGTFLADRASKASGKSSAGLVFASTHEIARLAKVELDRTRDGG